MNKELFKKIMDPVPIPAAMLMATLGRCAVKKCKGELEMLPYARVVRCTKCWKEWEVS